MLRFKLFGFPISIHWMFWVMTALLGGGLSASSPAEWQALLMWMVAAFLSILIHELGHTFLQRHFGARAQILLYAMGGLAIPDRGFNRGQHIIVSLAGPAVQIAVGFLAWAGLNAYVGNPLSWDAIRFASHGLMGSVPLPIVFGASFVLVSIFWGLFNLVPIMPLDGGHILLRILGPGREKTVWMIGLVCASAFALYMLLVWKSLWNTALFAMLAYENFQRMQGQKPPPFMHP